MAQNGPDGDDIGRESSGDYLDGAASANRGLEYRQDAEEIVQVVYQSNANGGLVGVGSTLLSSNDDYNGARYIDSPPVDERAREAMDSTAVDGEQSVGGAQLTSLPQPLRPASILPSVAEESSSGAGATYLGYEPPPAGEFGSELGTLEADYSGRPATCSAEQVAPAPYGAYQGLAEQADADQGQYYAQNPTALYSTISRHSRSSSARTFGYDNEPSLAYQPAASSQSTLESSQFYGIQSQPPESSPSLAYNESLYLENKSSCDQLSSIKTGPSSTLQSTKKLEEAELEVGAGNEPSFAENQRELDRTEFDDEKENAEDINEEIAQILARQKQGAAESGSLKNNFKKKLGISVSSNENELIAHRQKLLESQETNSGNQFEEEEGEPASLPLKFKRTHSVSFNVSSSRAGRHSVDIRNLPSYLTVKRASIVDVAKGAMSSLMHSFGAAGTGSGSGSQRRESTPDEEPIFEEPIAPTLSLGQRVALVKNSGAEFGTVGWIGQLPDVDDDWIVGVIFDNMIGNCDGAHNGVRYFYARQNYAMFVPLSTLTKTDNYIGRPETGTMLSRMSVSLKPGQLISIQRSSIRLQHCFLNAPHQRVGHDVRAVSNRLHCQCHNCGPCAHLTKQGRLNPITAFGAHHAPNKKNSLAHAAVEILAHHHHHYHEEEHREEDYQFGDNSAHACNYVRYSCCQQTGTGGHDFSADCELVRPELLDNLIHAPRAPHRRHRLRTSRPCQRPKLSEQQQYPQLSGFESKTLEYADAQTNLSLIEANSRTMSTWNESERAHSVSSYSSCSSSSSSEDAREPPYDNQITYDSSSYRANQSIYNTLETRMSLLEQQRFIAQPESSAIVQSQQSYMSDDYDYRSEGFGSSLRRCFNCIMGRKNRRRRPPKRKLSARNRMIEYRRKQSTFVPSTLAKPQEDFASHGILLPPAKLMHDGSNSDYSSYSRSSCSSRSSSPDNDLGGAGAVASREGQTFQQQTMTMEHGAPAPGDDLKSPHTVQDQTFSRQINYEDYSYGDGYCSYKKDEYSHDSALTDLGYFDTLTNSSNDTLKQIVDQTINEQEAHPGPILLVDNLPVISPISTAGSNQSEQVDVSSPTASINDQNEDAVCQRLECLELHRGDDPPADPST